MMKKKKERKKISIQRQATKLVPHFCSLFSNLRLRIYAVAVCDAIYECVGYVHGAPRERVILLQVFSTTWAQLEGQVDVTETSDATFQ